MTTSMLSTTTVPVIGNSILIQTTIHGDAVVSLDYWVERYQPVYNTDGNQTPYNIALSFMCFDTELQANYFRETYPQLCVEAASDDQEQGKQ
jgi:hypothetical protein